MPKTPSFLHNWVDVNPQFGIVRQVTTGLQGQKKIIALDPLYDAKNEQYIYNLRRSSNAPFVSAYGSQQLNVQKPPKRQKGQAKQPVDPYHHLAVITERIPFRLSDAPQLTHPEALYVLDRSLQGYQEAYHKLGPMRINDRMIGFNNQGLVKMWVNEDFANNHPSYPRRRLQSTIIDYNNFVNDRIVTPIDEADMVQQVVDTVENYNEQGRFPEPFASRIHQRYLSFPEARNILHQHIRENGIIVPDRIDLVTNRVRGMRTVTNTIQIPQPPVQQIIQQVVQPEPVVVQRPAVQQFVQQVTQPSTVVVQQPVIQRPISPVIQTVPQTIVQQQRATTGYRFNYLPVNQPYKPSIYASSFR